MDVTSNQTAQSVILSSPVDRLRFGGVLWRLSRRADALARPLAGKRWNPLFAVVVHHGRRSGQPYQTPVAARRVAAGFVISLAFGRQVDWHRNLQASAGGRIHWRGRDYVVGAPEPIDVETGLAAFHLIQRLFLRMGRIQHYVRVSDITPAR